MALITPQYLQTQSYTAAKDRYLIQKLGGLAAGIIGTGSFAVTQRGAGANMSVDVAAGDAWLLGTDTTRQGAYLVTNDALVNALTTTTGIAWPVGDGANPRIDQVILREFDTQDGSAANGNKSADNAQILVLVGTPTAGATLANRNGAAALPSSCIRLADVLMPAGSTTVTTANIADRRTVVSAGSGNVVAYGKSIIPATETLVAPVAYAFSTTADRVQNLVVPTDALIRVRLAATWLETVAGQARAALFIGANQLKIAHHTANPAVTQAAAITESVGGVDKPLMSYAGGLVSLYGGGAAYGGEVTTGQVVGLYGASQGVGQEINGATTQLANPAGVGGACDIFVAAGTYDVGVKFKAASGNVTVKNRKLWVEVISFG